MQIRERYLNFSSVAKDFHLNIDMVTDCFKEVVTAFRKLLYEKKNCELPFSNIGKLQIKNNLVTMKFYREFLERQNQYLKNRTEEEKNKFQATSFNPDWDADLYENQVYFILFSISYYLKYLTDIQLREQYFKKLLKISTMFQKCHMGMNPP